MKAAERTDRMTVRTAKAERRFGGTGHNPRTEREGRSFPMGVHSCTRPALFNPVWSVCTAWNSIEIPYLWGLALNLGCCTTIG